jgi:hypothetical protein
MLMKKFSTFDRRDAWNTKCRRPCPVLGNADSDAAGRHRYAGKICGRSAEIGLSSQFLHACMHSFTPRLEAEGAETPVHILIRLRCIRRDQPGIGMASRTRERDDSSCISPVQVAHIYPHYLLAASTTNLTRTWSFKEHMKSAVKTSATRKGGGSPPGHLKDKLKSTEDVGEKERGP